MAQDAFAAMAEEPWTLNEDGYLKVDADIKEITYHPSLNIIIICTRSGIVRVLDVNSGLILRSTDLAAQNATEIKCKYIPTLDRILFCDGLAIGVRTDYNGVLLLDSLLQKVQPDCKDNITIELLLSEAIILKQSLSGATVACAEKIVAELEKEIIEAQNANKKGIKAQKWTIASVNLPVEDLKLATSSVVSDFVMKKIHSSELQVASAVKERISEILGEQTMATDRKMMASEARRRETFSHWPHMDYKWALPEQMAQAGFYHEPNSSGDDRAMCFTCSVCLVSWERSDEPWGEHERHSPTCPFVAGEYTQNVPMSVTKATAPAIDATFLGNPVQILGCSTVPKLFPTCTKDGLISVFDILGKIKRIYSFYVTQFDTHILEKFNQDFGVAGLWIDERKGSVDKKVTALAIVSDKSSVNPLRPAVVCGITISRTLGKSAQENSNIFTTEQPQPELDQPRATPVSEIPDHHQDRRRLYLVVYDFTYSKENEEGSGGESDKEKKQHQEGKKSDTVAELENQLQQLDDCVVFDPLSNILDTITPGEMSNNEDYSLLKELTSFYKTFIPGETDAVFLPPSTTPALPPTANTNPSTTPGKKPFQHTGPRLLSLEKNNFTVDSSPTPYFQTPNNYIHYTTYIEGSLLLDPTNNEPTTISDHIVELKNNQSNKKLNYSRAVQCVSLPPICTQYHDLEIISILPLHDGEHLLVTVCSETENISFLIVYSLELKREGGGKVVKVREELVAFKQLPPKEKPTEVGLLPALSKFGKCEGGEAGGHGNAVLVCVDGAVRIVDLVLLKTIGMARIENEKFVSAAYCNSLDRLCAATADGSLHFFALNDSDNESVGDPEEDDLFGVSDNSIKELSSLDKVDSIQCFKEPPTVITDDDIKTMQKLTHFSPARFGYNVVVPACWSEFQAMRQRRATSIINPEAFTKTWRLQNDTTTWEEHIFEITLPSAVVLGHVDFHFTLQGGCTKPCVEVTLLRQTKSGIGHNKDQVKFSVDDTVTIDMLRRVENPVVSEEYLRAHNADILAGPVNINNHLDLTEQSGTVTLTSARMFKVRVRNLLLHVRAVYDKDDKRVRRRDSKGNAIPEKLSLPTRKNEQYLGCDCIHELSIAIYTPANNSQSPYEKTLRNLMLDSNVFIQSLVLTACDSDRSAVIKNVLDILNWMAAIRLVPNRAGNGEPLNEQLEFMFISAIGDNLSGLLRKCLLLGGRSIAHKCMSYVMTCIRGANNINKSIGDHFRNCVLNSVLKILDELKSVKSAAGLHWILALLLQVTRKENEPEVISKCATLLNEVSEDLRSRSNPYHLLLRSRYGLYGLPTEPELFDIEPPPFIKGSSAPPYTFAVSNANATNDGGANTITIEQPAAQGKETGAAAASAAGAPFARDPNDKLKYKNIAFPKLVKGLIETEPLHFTCVSTSDGTRLELADAMGVGGVVVAATAAASDSAAPVLNSVSPIVLSPQQMAPEQLYVKHIVEKGGQESTEWEKLEIGKIFEDPQSLDMKMEVVYKNFTSKGGGSGTSSATGVGFASCSQSGGGTANHLLPWRQLLVPPPRQVLVVERMHSGARRHVTLDFGSPVSLTDILIPSCLDLVSLTIDVWLLGEETDEVRLVTATDIATKNLLLSDLQPPPLCRYMKITLVGRYGMSTTRCRIPLGYFYGHVVVLPEENPNEAYVKPDYEKQLNVLSKLLEDIGCRYSLACSKLKDYLQPFLIADMKNTSHLSTYINILKDKSCNVSNAEHNKIFTAYQETLTYQHQLNTIRNVMSRIEASIYPCEDPTKTAPAVPILTDKLCNVAEGLLEVLLSLDSSCELTQETCERFFQGLCVSQSSRLQLLAAVFLEKCCGSGPFWGTFLADTLVNLFKTSCAAIFPQDRLFVLLIYLSRKSPERSAVIDAAMRVVYATLRPLEENRPLLLAINVDLPLLSWLLMYLSLQLTFWRNGNGDGDRWDWVLGEMVGKLVYTNGDTAATTSSSVATSSINKSKLLVGWQKNHTSNFKSSKCKILKKPTNGGETSGKSGEETRDPTCLRDLMLVPQKTPQYVDPTHCLAVSKLLVKFIITMDHSGSADMMLLSFKIISKLVTLAKLQLCQLVTESQLLELINFALACKVPWAPFALSCLLQDALTVSGPQNEDDDDYDESEGVEMDADGPASSSGWGTNQNDVSSAENDQPTADKFYFHMDEETKLKTTKALNNLGFRSLSSVYETSDDSDIEEVLESFEKQVKTGIKKEQKTQQSSATHSCHSTTVSNAIDARLETGVFLSSEIALRKLTGRNTQRLLHNISQDQYKETENPLTPWPEQVGPYQSECAAGNLKMLSNCFDVLFKDLQTREPNRIEHVLQLWLTVNCTRRDEKFDSSAMPLVKINTLSVNSLVSALAFTPGLSLTTWCLGLQALTLVCNTNSNGKKKWFDFSGMANAIVVHRDFVQLFVSLLAGGGSTYPDKGTAGPTLCKALHDFLIRLQVRCDIVSQSSKLGNLFKTLLLHVVYQLVKPGGPISTRTGPLDAQCKLLQSMLYLDFTNIDVSIGMSTLESTAVLLSSYFLNVDNIRCITVGESKCSVTSNFGEIFSSVLGTETNKQDRPVCHEDLLINLLKLLGKLVQTPIVCNEGVITDQEMTSSSQTDESKAEQIHYQDSVFVSPSSSSSSSSVQFFADTVLQHHPTIVTLCRCLAACKSSSLCMLTDLSQKFFNNISEPNTVGDAVYHILSLLARKASRKELIMEPLLLFLGQTPQLSEPLVWFILQVLVGEQAIRSFYESGGISILASSIVTTSNTPSIISRNGTISTVMQHFNGFSGQQDNQVHIAPASANKMFQASVENNNLINFAPYCTISCQSVTSQPADVLIQSVNGVTHRRARTPLWSYNYYQEETHTELLLQLPCAVLLKEVQLQPHAGGLATCPSFVAIETSANGPSRLVPACQPIPTSGLTYIRLHLPTAKVVNCVLIRLYKPRVGNSIGLLQIRLLGTYAFGRSTNSNIDEDEGYCSHSLGWLRLLHHCFTVSIDPDLKRQIKEEASRVSNLLDTCCGLLLVPSHISPVYLPCLEKVLRELALLTPENGIATIKILLDNRLSIVEPMMSLDNAWHDRLMVNVSGYQSACELLYQICEHQDSNTGQRVKMILDWLQTTACTCISTSDTSQCSAAYVSSIASILWFAHQSSTVTTYDLKSLITLEFFESIYQLKTVTSHDSFKYALDSLLCSLCYVRSEFFPLLLQKIGVLVPNLSRDLAASISDDRKDNEVMLEDSNQEEWYGHLIIGELTELNLSKDQLETVALASRSPTAIQQLLDSGLPKLLNNAIYEFCHNNNETSPVPMAKLEKVTAILQFFTDVCDEKMLRDWLGSPDGSSFWPHLLQWLCKKPFSSSSIQSESHVHLEEVCVKFLAKCCMCHPNNQSRLATVLCEVISKQQNGISGFLRRLLLQLLLENEKVPVSIEADETLYKSAKVAQVFVPAHPAFKQTYNRTMLYLSTSTTLADILEQHLIFNTILPSESKKPVKKDIQIIDTVQGYHIFSVKDFSELSVAAGVTAKDKRVKDLKNWRVSTPQSKKKRYANDGGGSGGNEVMEGRLVKCLTYSDEALPLQLNLAQLLRLVEAKGNTNDWPYVHLTICQSKSNEDKIQNKEAVELIQQQQPICSALQVFSQMGGLALLAQNLPTIYPEAVRITSNEKSISDQSDSEWIKLEEADDIYEDMEETVGGNSPTKTTGVISQIPPHSLTAFSLFLRLPGYAEVLLKDTKKALCLLRLLLGVTDDGEGGDIFSSPLANSLPTHPFEVLQRLYDTSPLCSDDGRFLRRISLTTGVLQLLLACLGILTHHAGSGTDKDGQKEQKNKEDRQHYWAKGTGFGTGSTQQSWNVEQALMKQKNEEEHVTVLLQVLASYINPNDGAGDELKGDVLPAQFVDFLAKSSLLPAISSYLRNDSVLDMARHIPLYKAVLKILRALAVSTQLVELLLPQRSKNGEPSVSFLLKNMKTCVDTYANKLRVQNAKGTDKNGKSSKSKSSGFIEDLEQGEGLATLMPDIQNTAAVVAEVTRDLIDETDTGGENALECRIGISPEEQYLRIMKNLQFASYEMIEEQPDGSIKFVISHHFESMAKTCPEQSHPSRVKRIAQETVTLSTSLPLSYSSSVFVRYDTSRLDVMKVLITGPADTPYANGCFELDVFFPPDYPSSPMLINLETTGHHTVRFNPNLYNDGKVCLSVLNTWHGRPEEKWNAQTSSFLQVLVSIQSLILVPEPYFNEPGYERARGTPAGTSNSRDYNLNICLATARWAMLNQIVNPCPCFKEVIHAHFYMKRREILDQVRKWIDELEVETRKEKKSQTRTVKKNRGAALDSFKKIYKDLQEQLAKLKPPSDDFEDILEPRQAQQEDEEDEDEEESPTTPTNNSMDVTIEVHPDPTYTEKDIENMVNEMLK
ncbi:baculoviral IAP repeat-containing protein 6 isoform X2 [Anthonomus grandis grandis]|uniref:baculoviral IAP repeat-containing protein 6 isoform X2 n=1 Tax=Anthonomus grandis grandis TaxID=2921223 RepID=UPI0021650900|nr:baculoviral IAP repeat-containing protein 6 isoform X2 [Anthonomus grandis grandis]